MPDEYRLDQRNDNIMKGIATEDYFVELDDKTGGIDSAYIDTFSNKSSVLDSLMKYMYSVYRK